MSPAMTDLPEAEVWNKLGIAAYTKVISPFWRELSLNQLNRSLWLALLGSDQKICNRHFFNKLICHKGVLAVLLGENFQQYKVKIISSRISGIQYIFKKKKSHKLSLVDFRIVIVLDEYTATKIYPQVRLQCAGRTTLSSWCLFQNSQPRF